MGQRGVARQGRGGSQVFVVSKTCTDVPAEDLARYKVMFHRARHLLIRDQTAIINSIRAYLAEFGIAAPSAQRRRSAGSQRQPKVSWRFRISERLTLSSCAKGLPSPDQPSVYSGPCLLPLDPLAANQGGLRYMRLVNT